MPNKIKSKAEMRMMQAIAHGWRPKNPRRRLPSAAAAKELIATQTKPTSKLPTRVRRKSR